MIKKKKKSLKKIQPITMKNLNLKIKMKTIKINKNKSKKLFHKSLQKIKHQLWC